MPVYTLTPVPPPCPHPTERTWVGGIELPRYDANLDRIEGHRTFILAADGTATNRITTDVRCRYAGSGRWEYELTRIVYVYDAEGDFVRGGEEFVRVARIVERHFEWSAVDEDALAAFRNKIVSARLAEAEKTRDRWAARLTK